MKSHSVRTVYQLIKNKLLTCLVAGLVSLYYETSDDLDCKHNKFM